MLLEAMEAHGGLEHWYGNGILHFQWAYHMKDVGPEAVVKTVQDVDNLTMSAVHQVPDSKIKFGLHQGEAWIHPADAQFAVPPRFWALTPYYFIGIPFVFADIGINAVAVLEDIEFEGAAYKQIKITYSQGTGDSPDDYYILLIHPETKKVKGARYIVTSPLIAKEGPLPETFITLEEYQNVSGVLLATKYRSFLMNANVIGKNIRHAVADDISFKPAGSVDFLPPADAKKM